MPLQPVPVSPTLRMYVVRAQRIQMRLARHLTGSQRVLRQDSRWSLEMTVIAATREARQDSDTALEDERTLAQLAERDRCNSFDSMLRNFRV